MALIPPVFLNSVAALGERQGDGSFRSLATGFLYGHPIGQTNEAGQPRYHVFLVTNRHVFQFASRHGGTMYVRLNRLNNAASNMYEMKLDDGSWTLHPDEDVDVAIVRLNAQVLKRDDIEYFFYQSDTNCLTRDQSVDTGLSEGDGLFVLGFPLGEAGEERNHAIVRQGMIARIQHWLQDKGRTFLIDASVYPGNSGGPVLLKPELTSVGDTPSNGRCLLIGMVSSYLTYTEVAISEQTGRRRMVFEENSGLAHVVPMDLIDETVTVALNR